MATGQIIVIVFFGVLSMIGLFGGILSKTEGNKTASVVLLFIVTFILLFCTTLAFIKTNECMKALEGKCPQYEKVENVYKLKK